MRVLLVVEDDADIAALVRALLGRESGFTLDGEAADIDGAVDAARSSQPDLIVLDHKLEGPQTGVEGAPMLKRAAPSSKIVMFSASEEARMLALDEPAIDAFVLKTRIDELLPTARRVLGLSD